MSFQLPYGESQIFLTEKSGNICQDETVYLIFKIYKNIPWGAKLWNLSVSISYPLNELFLLFQIVEEFWMCKMLASLFILCNSFRLETQVHFYFNSVVTHTVLCCLFSDHYLLTQIPVKSCFFAVLFWTQVLLVFSLPVKHCHIIPWEVFQFIKEKVILLIYWKEKVN